MAASSLNGLKTLWEKEKLLITSNFSFCHWVFKILLLQTRKNQGLFGKGFIQSCSPFPKQQISDFSKLKDFADNNFKFDENGRKFAKKTEKTVGKGEIACYKQLLLFPLCFQKTSSADT